MTVSAEKRREYNQRYLKKHPQRRKATLNKYNTSPKGKAAYKRWVSKNPDRDKELKRKHYLQNKERYDAAAASYWKERPAEKAAHCAKRRSKKLKATPSWLTPEDYEQIKAMYVQAKQHSEITGYKWEVDHIVPLQGKEVSGLHVPWNLQVIPRTENIKKRNKLILVE